MCTVAARVSLVTAALLWQLSVAAGCTCPPPTRAIADRPPDTPAQTSQLPENQRVQLVATSHPDFARVEGAGQRNRCSADQDCFVGGCSGEVCSAAPELRSTCSTRTWPSAGGLCGCMEGLCRWYQSAPSSSPRTPTPPPSPSPPPSPTPTPSPPPPPPGT